MKLTFQIEPVSQAWNEVMVLATQHWQGTKSYRRHEPFCPSFDRYQSCNQSGFFQLFTARDGEKLAAYFGAYLSNSMHSQKLMMTEDTFYIAPEYRGGRNALRFLQHIEKQAHEWGVTEIMFSCEIDNETGIKGLLEWLDFHPVIVQFSKRLALPPASDTGTAQMEPVQCPHSQDSN